MTALSFCRAWSLVAFWQNQPQFKVGFIDENYLDGFIDIKAARAVLSLFPAPACTKTARKRLPNLSLKQKKCTTPHATTSNDLKSWKCGGGGVQVCRQAGGWASALFPKRDGLLHLNCEFVNTCACLPFNALCKSESTCLCLHAWCICVHLSALVRARVRMQREACCSYISVQFVPRPQIEIPFSGGKLSPTSPSGTQWIKIQISLTLHRCSLPPLCLSARLSTPSYPLPLPLCLPGCFALCPLISSPYYPFLSAPLISCYPFLRRSSPASLTPPPQHTQTHHPSCATSHSPLWLRLSHPPSLFAFHSYLPLPLILATSRQTFRGCGRLDGFIPGGARRRRISHSVIKLNERVFQGGFKQGKWIFVMSLRALITQQTPSSQVLVTSFHKTPAVLLHMCKELKQAEKPSSFLLESVNMRYKKNF